MVFKNVTDLMKRHTALFVILLISQIFTLLSIFFVFGVFQNNLYELCDNHDSKSLEATIDNQKITSDDINKIFMTMVEEEIPIDYFYVEAESKDGKKSFLDRAQYKNGKYGYSDSVYENMKYGLQGSYYEDKDYRNKNKVVVINGEDKKDVGDTIVLGEETFDIIGKDDINDPGEYEIPFTAFPKNCVWIRLNFGLAQLPTRAQYETFRDLLLSYGCKPAEFYVSNNADLRQEYSMLVVSALLAILAGVNMYMKRMKKVSGRTRRREVTTICVLSV